MAPARTQRRTATSARASAGGGRSGSRATSTSSRTRSTTAAKSRSGSKSAARTTQHRSAPARGRAGASLSRPRRGNPRGGARFTTTLVIAAILVAAWTIYPVLRLQYQQERERQTVAAELAGLKDRNEELRAQVDQLKTPEGVEQVARESLGLVKPGEQVYVVTGSAAGETTATIGSHADDGTPLWQQALDALFGFR